jgi:hypothetical protein
VFILKGVKVLCFDTLLQVLILKGVTERRKRPETSMSSGLDALRFASFLRLPDFYGETKAKPR